MRAPRWVATAVTMSTAFLGVPDVEQGPGRLVDGREDLLVELPGRGGDRWPRPPDGGRPGAPAGPAGAAARGGESGPALVPGLALEHLGRDVVERFVDRAHQPLAEALDLPMRGLVGLADDLADDLAGGGLDRPAVGHEIADGEDPSHVGLAVAAVAAGGSDRPEDPVPLLPRPERRDGDARPSGDVPDRQRTRWIVMPHGNLLT